MNSHKNTLQQQLNTHQNTSELIKKYQIILDEFLLTKEHNYTSDGAFFLEISNTIRMYFATERNLTKNISHLIIDAQKIVPHEKEQKDFIDMLDNLHNQFLEADNKNYIQVLKKLSRLLRIITIHIHNSDTEFISHIRAINN